MSDKQLLVLLQAKLTQLEVIKENLEKEMLRFPELKSSFKSPFGGREVWYAPALDGLDGFMEQLRHDIDKLDTGVNQ